MLFTDIDIYHPCMTNENFLIDYLPNSGYKKADKLKKTLTEVKNNTQFGIELYRLIYIKWKYHIVNKNQSMY